MLAFFQWDSTAQQGKLPDPWRQNSFAIGWTADRTIPKIDHGYLEFSRRILRKGPERDAIHLNSLADGRAQDIPFWLNGAAVIWVDDVAIAPDDSLIVVGSLSPDAKRAVNFMSHVDGAGHSLATVNMGTYEPELACVEVDGSIWTLGQDWGAERSDISYPMLRNYSSSGQLLQSYLVNDTIPPIKLNLSTRLHGLGSAPGRVFLQCGKNSVGAYIGPARLWAEVSLANHSFQAWNVALPSAGNVTGLALTGEHAVYCSFKAANKTIYTRGFFKLNLGQGKSASWEPVPGAVSFTAIDGSLSAPVALAGSDGASFVYAKWPDNNQESKGTLFWVKP